MFRGKLVKREQFGHLMWVARIYSLEDGKVYWEDACSKRSVLVPELEEALRAFNYCARLGSVKFESWHWLEEEL